MFLDIVKKRNPNLIDISIKLHQEKRVLPDSYILDLDSILENARLLIQEANKYNIKLYAMTKQFGRIPFIAKELVKIGFAGIVAVDFKEALTMIKHNIPLGNVGHLVQIPSGAMEIIINSNPEIITVYSLEKIIEIDKYAKKLNKIQDIMLRVLDSDSEIYEGQAGGFYIDNLSSLLLKIKDLKNIKINGLTSFPCFLYDKHSNKIKKTNNVDIIKRAQKILNNFNIFPEQLNMPSATSLENIKDIHNFGGTHGEPGHALTGTTPFNGNNLQGEIPSMIYLSEISHNLKDKSFCYGGGHYRRSCAHKVLVGKDITSMKKIKIVPPSMESIDYYFQLEENSTVNDSVIGAFRTQIFVTRSDVVLIKGIKNNNPEIIGIYDSFGREK